MCCRVPEDLILFRLIGGNQVCYLYFPISFWLQPLFGALVAN
jgi:hypothetical protein